MRAALKTGLSFGLTSGVITTLGLMVGLNAGTHSKASVVGGILTVAIADAFSDALGIHVTEESQNKISNKMVWQATLATFAAKFFFAMTFVVPIALLDLAQAVPVSLVWGLSILSIYTYFMAKQRKENILHAMVEHVAIALVVIVLTQIAGSWIAAVFK